MTRRRHDLLVLDQDPSLPQRLAAHPDSNVWVGASAGTGKTKVLTDRVLRLLLPRDDGRPGTPPHRILCLTYTKAAAGEMALRLNRILSQWATSNHTELDKALYDLLGRPPNQTETDAARRLFARVVDAPGGLKIMTIHSFCQSVLGRFPLEASLPPNFSAMDDMEAATLLTRARDIVLARAQSRADSEEGQALNALAAEQTEDDFNGLLRALTAERHQLHRIVTQLQGKAPFFAAICRTLDVHPDDTPHSLMLEACADDAFNHVGLRQACAALAASGAPSDAAIAEPLAAFLETDQALRSFDALCKALTTENRDTRALQPRARLGTKKAIAIYAGCPDVLQAEAERQLAARERINACRLARLTHDLATLGLAITDEYEILKNRRGALDFDDLIQMTLRLLNDDRAAWVLYKLDGGLDHILIDEAQDTNPEQWDIADLLSAEFFAGHSARDITRTLFVVGDAKQSIYSFQRAAPEKFAAMRARFRLKVEGADRTWRDVPLATSFRSSPSVLDFVDALFEGDSGRKGLGEALVEHRSWRHGHAGLVELWPLFKIDPPGNGDLWQPSLEAKNSRKASVLLAEYMAQAVKDWIGNEMLPSKGRAVQPGDILVLIRRRSSFVNSLIRALKKAGVPVSGVDRMALNEQLAVQDLMAVAGAALLPEDDLTLACVLKSPFVGWDDARLEALALPRRPDESLWHALQSAEPALAEWFRALIWQAGIDRPYEFFSRLLNSPCPGHAVSGLYAVSARLGDEALDPLNEFLNQALLFEKNNIAALQLFMIWQAQDDRDVKREQEEAGGKVRIMTVHAAKGLQAPIVFLPDTVTDRKGGHGRSGKRLIWPDKTGLDVPLWSPRRASDAGPYTDAMARVQDREDDEYRRLLYVAATRAEDRLYICGHEGRNAPLRDCWYMLMRDAFVQFDDVERFDFKGPEDLSAEEEWQGLRIGNPQIAVPEQAKPLADAATAPDLGQPDWLWVRAAPKEEPHPPRPLMPSRPSEPEPPALSPLAGDQNYRFQRGNLTHRLLQYLPDLFPERREQAAIDFIGRNAGDLPPPIQKEIAAETLGILNDPAFAPLFGPASQAEVPITGITGGQLVSAQIDRLVVTENAIWIVDYKTSRPPPSDVRDVPPRYRRQMESYAAILSVIWPGRTIRTFLLWTDGARMMEL